MSFRKGVFYDTRPTWRVQGPHHPCLCRNSTCSRFPFLRVVARLSAILRLRPSAEGGTFRDSKIPKFVLCGMYMFMSSKPMSNPYPGVHQCLFSNLHLRFYFTISLHIYGFGFGVRLRSGPRQRSRARLRLLAICVQMFIDVHFFFCVFVFTDCSLFLHCRGHKGTSASVTLFHLKQCVCS